MEVVLDLPDPEAGGGREVAIAAMDSLVLHLVLRMMLVCCHKPSTPQGLVARGLRPWRCEWSPRALLPHHQDAIHGAALLRGDSVVSSAEASAVVRRHGPGRVPSRPFIDHTPLGATEVCVIAKQSRAINELRPSGLHG